MDHSNTGINLTTQAMMTKDDDDHDGGDCDADGTDGC